MWVNNSHRMTKIRTIYKTIKTRHYCDLSYFRARNNVRMLGGETFHGNTFNFSQTDPTSVRCCFYRTNTGPVLAHYDTWDNCLIFHKRMLVLANICAGSIDLIPTCMFMARIWFFVSLIYNRFVLVC